MRRKMHPNAARYLRKNAKVIEATRQAAEDVAQRAAKRAPKRTGAGAASIHAERHNTPAGVEYRVSWDTDHYYMLFQEVGTEDQKARPFLRPAARGLVARQRRAFRKSQTP